MGSIFRVVTRLTPAGLLPFSGNVLDQPEGLPKEPSTGMERLQRMYRMRTNDGVSEEMNIVIQSSCTGALFGAIIGGWVRSRNAYMYFIENNEATIFKTTMDAKKLLQNQVTVAFGRGAYQWGWRLGLFTGIFSLITTSFQVYHDKVTIWEYVMAGFVTGGLFKLNLGLAATIVGAVTVWLATLAARLFRWQYDRGAVLSAFFGGIIVLMLTITGVKIEDIRKALFKLRDFRERHFNSALEKSADNKHDKVTHEYDVIVAERGEQKIEDIQ